MIPRAKDGQRRRLNRTFHGLGHSLGALEERMMPNGVRNQWLRLS